LKANFEGGKFLFSKISPTISISSMIFRFLLKFFFFENFDFCWNFFFLKISIFVENFDFCWNFRVLLKFSIFFCFDNLDFLKRVIYRPELRRPEAAWVLRHDLYKLPYFDDFRILKQIWKTKICNFQIFNFYYEISYSISILTVILISTMIPAIWSLSKI